MTLRLNGYAHWLPKFAPAIQGTAKLAAAPIFAVFGEKFTRNDNNAVNASLNYAYAVIRGRRCPIPALYGWLPALTCFIKANSIPSILPTTLSNHCARLLT